MKNTTTTLSNSLKNSVKILVAILAALFMSCTAYFNTFYNAEEAFKEGLNAHLEILRNYPDSLIVTPTSDISAKYDRAIEKANKTIESFQKKKKWHDDALFLMGKAYYYKKEMDKAIFRLRQLEREFPENRYIPESHIFIAKAHIGNGSFDKAEEVLLNAEKRFPELNKDQQITLLMITIAIRRNGKSQAIALLEKTLKTIKSDKVRLDLYLKTAELYIELKMYEKAIVLLKSAPRKKDYPVQLYRIDRALFTSFKHLDSLDLALKLIDKMISEKIYSSFMDEMLYHKGLLVFARGDIEEAIKILKKLTAGIDSSTIMSDTSSYKAKALLELAFIHQKQKEDYNKSYSLFKLAALSRDTGSQNVARRLVSAIERLKNLRDSLDMPDSTHGGRKFAIGELFRFDLDESDSAFAQFIAICKDTGTDSGFIPKAMLQAAIIARNDLNDKVVGDSIFEEIIARFPASEYAKNAQRELDIPVTVTTKSDSAEQLFRDAEQLFYRQNKVKEAIQQFYDIAKQFPDVPIAPKSLFAAAWISSTVLFKQKTSKMLYEKICKDYPESEYCTDIAKPRIKVVVDTLAKLDQIRRDNLVKEQKSPPTVKRNATKNNPRGKDESSLDTNNTSGEDASTLIRDDTSQNKVPEDDDTFQILPEESTSDK